MRLVLLNPHANYFGKLTFQWLFDYAQLKTYSYILECYGKDDKRKIAFFVDGEQSSFQQTFLYKKLKRRFPTLMKIFSYLEFFVWMVINRISPFRHKIYFRLKKLTPENDIIFTFALTNSNPKLHQYNGIVIVHLTHYHLDTENHYNYFKKLKHGFLVAENDLTHNSYFKHYFPDVSSVYHLPFVFSKRFKKIKAFKDRTNKCFASGPLGMPSASSYVKYFGECSALHPMRKILYDNKEGMKDIIDCYIFPNIDVLKDLKEIKKSDNFIVRLAKKHLPGSILKKLFKYQISYFKFDILEKYNQNKMFMSPEEQTGLPSMKMFEGMACGSVLVAIDDVMYTNIGFKDKINYIAYKTNDLKDLISKLAYYNNHSRELEQIAENGYQFAIDNFNQEMVAGKFWNDLEKLLDTLKKGQPRFDCSFLVASNHNL